MVACLQELKKSQCAISTCTTNASRLLFRKSNKLWQLVDKEAKDSKEADPFKVKTLLVRVPILKIVEAKQEEIDQAVAVINLEVAQMLM